MEKKSYGPALNVTDRGIVQLPSKYYGFASPFQCCQWDSSETDSEYPSPMDL